jgi:hypothetical protein
MMELDLPVHQPMEGWEGVYGKLSKVVVGHQQYFPTYMKPHPYEGRGRCGASPYIASKEI